MNKLVSKNPVQRFKQGKKILKAEEGLGLNDPYISRGNRLKSWLKETFSDWNPYSGFIGKSNLTNQQQQQQTTIPNNSSNNNQQQQTKDYSWMKGGTRQRTAEEEARLKDPKVQAYLNKQQSSTTKPATAGTKVVAKQPASYQFGKMGGWNKSMKNNITDEESLRMLKEMGMENYSAGQVQDEINKQFGTNAVKRDDRWGNQSRAGLRSLYENWKLQNNNNSSINLPSKTLNSIAVNQEPITPEQQTEQAIVNNNFKTIENNGQKYFARTGNYNKSQLRGYMRQMGLNPYDFTGSERKALRLWLNGQSNDNSLLTGRLRDLFVTPYGYKQGGQLVSRNPVKRFKSNFRLVAQ